MMKVSLRYIAGTHLQLTLIPRNLPKDAIQLILTYAIQRTPCILLTKVRESSDICMQTTVMYSPLYILLVASS